MYRYIYLYIIIYIYYRARVRAYACVYVRMCMHESYFDNSGIGIQYNTVIRVFHSQTSSIIHINATSE